MGQSEAALPGHEVEDSSLQHGDVLSAGVDSGHAVHPEGHGHS